MIYIVILIVVLLLVSLASMWLRQRREFASLRAKIRGIQGKYSFLIDKDFRVKETNFYKYNKELDDGQPRVLGNVLHCQSGCDSGLCGTGISCRTCPLRIVLTNSFVQKRDFEKIMATMNVYDANRKAKQVEVCVDGHLVTMGNEPLLMVNVTKVDSDKKQK